MSINIEKTVQLARTMAAIGFYGKAASLVLIANTAIAEEAVAPKVEAAPPRTEFYLKFDNNDLQILSTAAMELPKKIADPFIAKMQAQLAAQTQQANEAAAKAGAK